MKDFQTTYGPWAIVAGASEGLGAAFAEELASRGLHLILIARREKVLERLKESIQNKYAVDIQCMAIDLSDTDKLANKIQNLSQEIGLLIYNAAYSPIGYFKDVAAEQLLKATDVNVKAPLLLTKLVSKPMLERQRGGIVLMSSLSGLQGSPKIATYSATKSFNTTLAEALWREFKDSNVDVLACVAGAIRTPGYIASQDGQPDAPGTLDSSDVVSQTLSALGKGPSVVPGFVNRFARFFMIRLMPRKTSISIMYNNTKNLT